MASTRPCSQPQGVTGSQDLALPPPASNEFPSHSEDGRSPLCIAESCPFFSAEISLIQTSTSHSEPVFYCCEDTS